MGFFKPRQVEKSYDLLGSFSWYTPRISGLFAILGWFLVGMVLASVVTMPLLMSGVDMCYVILIMYPLQFVPVLIHAKFISSRNAMFERGFRLDSNHFGSKGGAVMAILAILSTIGASMMLELVNNYLPEMSDKMKSTMEMITDGPLWSTLICVGIFAPIFEEWMCRGLILRGLLNFERKPAVPGDTGRRGLSPALAIVISALFFAVIHGNIWQGITAFMIGALFGYVYYRTGSLKLTMLMHCTNNTLSVLMSHFGGEKIQDAKSILDVIPLWEYFMIFIISAAIVWYFVKCLSKVRLEGAEGNNCDVIPSHEDIRRRELAEAEAAE